jgi:hypothetical protein
MRDEIIIGTDIKPDTKLDGRKRRKTTSISKTKKIRVRKK